MTSTSQSQEWIADLEQGEDENFEQLMHERWREALERCKTRLGEDDALLAEQLGSPQAILDDIQTKAGEQSWRRKLRMQLIPVIRAIRSFFTLFVLALPSHSVETTIAWGVFYLVIQLCLNSEERYQRIIQIYNELRKLLLKIIHFTGHFSEEEEIKEALVDVNVTLLEFWASAVKELRKHPLEILKDQSLWKDIDVHLDRTRLELEQIYTTVRDFADHAIPIHTATNGTSLGGEGPEFPLIVVPIPENPRFLGRREILTKVHQHLSPASRGSKLHCFTLYGMGGVGKTQTAVAYAYLYGGIDRPDRVYDAVFWVASETVAAIRESFASIASALQLKGVSKTTDPQQVCREVQTWLLRTNKNWLLVYDNAERWDVLMQYWPQSSSTGSIIVTSRDHALSGQPASAGEELPIMDYDESVALFKTLLKSWDARDDREMRSVIRLLAELDGLPLAIQQIASLINAQDSSVSDFLELYTKHSDQLHRDRGLDSGIYYPHSLDTVWDLTFKQLASTPDAALLLGIFCMLSPDSIQEELLSPAKPVNLAPSFEFCKHPLRWLKVIQVLRASSLIRKTRKNIRIHRLTQAAYFSRMDGHTKEVVFCAAAKFVYEAFPKQHMGDPLLPNWKECSMYVLHAQSLSLRWSNAADENHKIDAPIEFVKLICNAAWYLFEISDYDGASWLIDIGQRAAGCGREYDELTSHLLNTAGNIQCFRFNYSTSRTLLEQCLKMRMRIYEINDPSITGIKSNLASLVACQGLHAEALELYRNAEAEGSGAKYSAQDRRLELCRYAANYGRLNTLLGNFSEADSQLRRSKSILESGDDNPLYGRAIAYCFGNLRLAERKWDEAKTYYENVLKDFDQMVCHRDRLRTCGCHYKLALIHMNLNPPRPERIRYYLQEASEIATQVGSMGYLGRVLLAKAEASSRIEGFSQPMEESSETLDMRAQAIWDGMESMHGGERPAERAFELYIPWQYR